MMRSLLSVCLVVVCLSCSCKASDAATNTTCNNTVPHLKVLQRAGVKIFKSPVFTSTKCSTEWKTFGSCCNESRLVKYVLEDQGESSLYITEMMKEIAAVHQNMGLSVSELQELISLIDSHKIGLRRLSRNETIASVRLRTLEYANMAKQWIPEIEGFMGYLKDIESHFEQTQSKCVTNINMMRSRAVCSICSGRSHVYFWKGKALIEQAACDEFVHSCYDSWLMLLKLATSIKRWQEVLFSSVRSGMRLWSMNRNPLIDSLLRWFERSGLAKNIASCGNRGAEGCSDSTNQAVCDSILNLARPSFFKATRMHLKKAISRGMDYRLAKEKAALAGLLEKVSSGKSQTSKFKLEIERKKVIIHILSFLCDRLAKLTELTQLDKTKLELAEHLAASQAWSIPANSSRTPNSRLLSSGRAESVQFSLGSVALSEPGHALLSGLFLSDVSVATHDFFMVSHLRPVSFDASAAFP